MPNFSFKGRDAQGKLVTGVRSAQSADALSKLLASESIIPTEILLKEEKAAQATKSHSGPKLFERKRITPSELTFFTRQMYTLTKAGVPLIFALQHMVSNTRNAFFSQVLQNIAKNLESGQGLAAALAHYPNVFPPLVVGMVQVGESSGRLDEVFLQLTQFLELEGSTFKRVKSSLRYPIFVMLAIVIGIVIINIFVIPTFSKVYAQENVPLPKITVYLVAFSNFMVNHWKAILFTFLGLFLLIRRYIKTPQGRYKWDRLKLRIPVMGPLLQRVILLRFSQAFAIIINSGIPVIEGLKLVANSIDNAYAKSEIVEMQNAIQRGNSIIQAVYQCRLFTPIEIQMLSISEQTGELGAMLNEIALYYQREVDYDLKRLTDMIEPIVLIAIASMVLMLALAVYLPIWNMVKFAGRGHG